MAPADKEQIKQIIKEAMTESLVAFFGENKYSTTGVAGAWPDKQKTDAIGKQYTPKQGTNGQKPIKYEPGDE
jgi:hypothetical protein